MFYSGIYSKKVYMVYLHSSLIIPNDGVCTLEAAVLGVKGIKSLSGSLLAGHLV